MNCSHYLRAVAAVERLFGADHALAGIPKILHQTFACPQSLPDDLQRNLDTLRRRNPGWQLRLYGDRDIEDFIGTHYGAAVLSQYLRINPAYGAARADLFRYLCIYACGGVYLDIKSSAERPLDAVLRSDEQCVLSQWGAQYAGWGRHTQIADVPGGEYQQWHVIAAAGHPFLKQVILAVLRNIEHYTPTPWNVGKAGVLALTGPIAYTRAIHPLRSHHPHRLIDVCAEAGFRYSIYGGEAHRHHALFAVHYTQLTEPVVQLSAAQHAVWLARRLALKLQAAWVQGRSLTAR